jgi:hypothetical protein
LTALADRPTRVLTPRDRSTYRKDTRRKAPPRAEPIVLWTVAFAAYLLLGRRVTLDLHVLPGDAVSRMTHAYYVFWNEPPKLAAIGFVWPPLITLVFLPLVAIKPLATSMWALPLMSSAFGAALLVTLANFLRRAGMPAPARLLLVLLFGVNPMVALYASNGMSEVLGWWCLTLAVIAFVRWYWDELPQQLIVAGVFVALGTLVRYEIVLWGFVLVPVVALTLWRRGRPLVQFEASSLALMAPILYALGVWTFLNWAILGSPFSWLHEETTQTFVWTKGNGPIVGHLTVPRTLHFVLVENLRLFPPVLILAAVTLLLALVLRSVSALALFAALVLNAATTIYLAVSEQATHILELRFNTRAMPIVLVAVGWLYRAFPSRLARALTVAGAAAALAASIPVTWHTMRTFAYQLDERAFASALATGRDQSHSIPGIDPLADARMARYVLRHVHDRNAILTDDAQTYDVIIRTGRPTLFADRIDHGDAFWGELAHLPFGRVQYLLFSTLPNDRLTAIYPRSRRDAKHGLRLAYRTRSALLYRIVGAVR